MAKTKVVEKLPAVPNSRDRGALMWNLRHALVSKQEDSGEIYKRQVEEDADPFEQYYPPSGHILVPPFNFANLYKIYEEGDVLAECVDAMIQNVDGFGYQLQYLGEDQELDGDKEAARERVKAENFFDRVNDQQSFTTIRKLMRQDLEVLGNGTFEIVPNNFGEPQMMFYLPFRRVRLARIDKKPTVVTVRIPRDGKVIEVNMRKYFRKFCQISAVTGLKLRWYKEFGDPRILDAISGEYVESRREAKVVASEVMHLKIPFADSPYGVPRWIQSSLDILGRRNSQYVNWDLFQSQGIPPIIITVSGGVLTDDSLQELETVIRSSRGVEKWNRIMLLESNPESQGLEDKGSAKIEVKTMSEFRKEDQMFTQYLEQAAESTRHRFRLPPLYTGWASTFCFSEDTETLTIDGWKALCALKDEETVGTIDPKTGGLEYHSGKLFTFDHSSLMVHIKNKVTDILVTPNHKMWVTIPTGHRSFGEFSKWEKKEAYTLSSYDRVIFQAAPFSFDGGSDFKDLKLADGTEVPFDLLLELVGWYVADGSLGTEEKDDRVRFCVSRHEKKEALGQLLLSFEDIGFKTVRYPYNREGGLEEFAIKNKEIKNWLRENCGDHAINKRLPPLFHDLTANGASKVLGTMIKGDGHEDNRMFIYSTTSKQLRDQTQILGLKCGWRSTVAETRPGAWQVYLCPEKNYHSIQGKDVSFELYEGKVYCFEVPGHLFITRRNGKVTVQSNTHATSKSAKEVAEEQIFIPERSQFDEPVNSRLMPLLEIRKWKFVTKGPQIVGSEEISAGVGAFQAAGAFTVNHAIAMANQAFGLEMSQFKEKWASYPFPIVIRLLELGRLKEVDSIAEKPAALAIPDFGGGGFPPKGLPFGKKPEVKQLPFKKAIKAAEMFSDEELGLYDRLKALQELIEGVRA